MTSWAALERLPTRSRARRGILLAEDQEQNREIDVKEFGLVERKNKVPVVMRNSFRPTSMAAVARLSSENSKPNQTPRRGISIGKIWSKVVAEIWGRELQKVFNSIRCRSGRKKSRRKQRSRSRDGREIAKSFMWFMKKSRVFF
ncbi:hypothetical protein DVH24_006218 [Malus domestica]|uniref:Uncharacterized protein n=1 Tax=Malus domestica TaxID=3750 RepID=A0A498KC14_MALDO|nr:hypothetical protein DVH24_006218 [Malus domestica]